MSSVIEINDVDRLAGYRLVWNSLLPQTPGASFFQSLDWLEVYWRHFGAAQRLRVLIVYSAGQPIGILPLTIRTEPSRLGNLRTLTYPLDDWGAFFGPIGPNLTATLLAGLGHIRRTARDWDLIDLRWIDELGVDRGRTRRVLELEKFPARGSCMPESMQVDLSNDWDTYWASRTSKWRNNVRRSEKKLAALGPIEHVRYRPAGAACGDGDPRWDLYDACEELARRSWQGSSQDGNTLTHATVRPFLRDAHAAAAKAGTADINLLLSAGRPVAFSYAYQYRGSVFGLRTGYDPALGSCGAGTVLQARMIADSFSRGDHTYDLGADYHDCKRYWQTHLRPVYRYTHFPSDDARMQLLGAKRWLSNKWKRRKAAQLALPLNEGKLVQR